MSDIFEHIKDDDLISEVESRGLEDHFTEDLVTHIDELDYELSILEVKVYDSESVKDSMRPIMELFKSKETEKLNKELSDLFYELFGVIV